MKLRTTRSPVDAHVGEINLVPYMDIMVNLVMFLLASMTSFVDMNIVNVTTPQISPDPGPPGPSGPSVLVGVVQGKGFLVQVDGQPLEGTPANGVTVPVRPDGRYDYEGLTGRMASVKSLHPDQRQLTLVPDRSIDYATVVRTMDATRQGPGGRLLFPDVVLSTM